MFRVISIREIYSIFLQTSLYRFISFSNCESMSRVLFQFIEIWASIFFRERAWARISLRGKQYDQYKP